VNGNVLVTLAIAVGGFFAGSLIVAGIISWIHKSIALRKEGSSWKVVAASSLLNSAPWTIVVAGIFVYFTHSEPWSVWLFAGACVGALYLVGLVAYGERNRKKNAA